MYSQAADKSRVQDVISHLQSHLSDVHRLLALLTSPLASLDLLPQQYQRYNVEPLPTGSVDVHIHVPAIQTTILKDVLPTWDASLHEIGAFDLLQQYFCPTSDNRARNIDIAGEVALSAYSVIITQPFTNYTVRILTCLSRYYPINRLYATIFSRGSAESAQRTVLWEDHIRTVAAIPNKVANTLQGQDIPHALEFGQYFTNVCVQTEALIASLASDHSKDAIPSLSFLLSKLANLGIFPLSKPSISSQPAFFLILLPIIRSRLVTDACFQYAKLWSSVLSGLSSSFVLQTVLTSLFASFDPLEDPLEDSSASRTLVKRDALLLLNIVGTLCPDNDEVWETVSAIIAGKEWSIYHARIYACWVAGVHSDGADIKVMWKFLDNIVDIWSSPEHIRHSLISRHRYFTALLLLIVSYIPPSSGYLESLAFSQNFISGIGNYVALLDPSIRICGMLSAEIVAHLTGKTLDFGIWDGDKPEQVWARRVRVLISGRDSDTETIIMDERSPVHPVDNYAEKMTTVPHKVVLSRKPDGYDSDDSVVGYESPPSSRSPSPTPSNLEEIEKDPSLNVGVKKVPRPVYLVQLGDLLRGPSSQHSNDEPHEADRIEMALNCAEELIRKKKNYGTELDENAVNLTYALLGLQNNFDLEDFDVKRQAALNALVACCPRKGAPTLIQEFFKNQYSTSQRYVALNALALGAAEMASLPIPRPSVSADRMSFPSKMLPAPLHERYMTDADQAPVSFIVDQIRRQAIDRGAEETVDRVPEIVRERRLRIRPRERIQELSSRAPAVATSKSRQQEMTFTKLGVEYFVAPLINHFWLFLRDEQTREERTSHMEGRYRYHGAGTGLILNPIVLAHFLKTLAVLVHASQNAPEWLHIVAPDALELAVTLGTRPVSRAENDTGDVDDSSGKEASVLTSALELAMIILDGCLELDGGRVLGLEHTTLLLSTGEWASTVFSLLEKGIRVVGGGGLHETKLRSAAAGVIIKVDRLIERWRGSMLDVR